MYKGVLSGEIKSVLKAELMIPAQAALDMNKIDTVAYYEIYEQVCKNVEDGIPFKECVKLVDKRIDWYSLK
jgi:hypothetical protein